jgi:hypothetical protein
MHHEEENLYINNEAQILKKLAMLETYEEME